MAAYASQHSALIPKITKLKLALIVVSMILLAVLGFWGTEKIATSHPILADIARSISELLFLSGVVSVIADLLLRKDLAAFWLDAIGVHDSIRDAGLEQITLDFHHFDFADWFRHAREVDICVIHATPWVGTEYNDIKALLSREGTLARFCVLDENSPCLDSFEESFRYPKGELRDRITKTVGSLRYCAEDLRTQGELRGQLKIYKHNRPPRYTSYRFDERIAFVPYRQSYGRAMIPVLVFRRGGGISQFLEEDFRQLIDEHSTPVYDSAQGAANTNGKKK